jgi:dihydroxy-acid dehydratase
MLAGTLGDRTVDLISVFEAVGARHTGRINEETFTQLENCACPGVGSCAGMFTASSMNCLSEALGLALPGSGTLPAVSAARMRLAKEAGMKVMALMEKDIRPRGHSIPEKVRAKQKIRKLNGLPTSGPSIFKEWFMACLGT